MCRKVSHHIHKGSVYGKMVVIPYMDLILKKSKEPFTRRFKCKFCKNDYASPSGRRRHEKKVHINTDASNQNDCKTSKLRESPESL